jgi:hypothetical protein
MREDMPHQRGNTAGFSPQEFYEANATNVCNVPRVGHPEDPSGWAGVRRASEARFVAGDCLVMTLADAFDFAEKYKIATSKELAENDSE